MQHGVVKVRLGGEDRILKFNNYFFVEIAMILSCDPMEVNIKIAEMGAKKPMRAITIITHAGMAAYQEEIANYNWNVTMQDTSKWIADSDQNEFSSVFEAFKQATGISDTLNNQNNTAVKKTDDTDEKKN